jgi:hypothetical protein
VSRIARDIVKTELQHHEETLVASTRETKLHDPPPTAGWCGSM